MFSCTRSFTKCDDLYSEISTVFRSITIIFVWGEYIYNLLVRGFDMSKIVYSLPKTINFQEIQIQMPLECDNFVFRKVNWPLSLRRGGWVGFRLTAKLPLSETKSNCQRSLNICIIFVKIEILLLKIFFRAKGLFTTAWDFICSNWVW